MAISKVKKKALFENFGQHPQDVGSPQVQIAVLTERINHLTEHLSRNKKDHATHRGQLQLVSRRRRLLDYLRRTEPDQYLQIIAKLGIRK
ncbi:MAG TPA: 30S ribosomal protein S15 [Pirellulaceae bacterium]|nr:30S ribosomal protein S15 [Pirellulaceae bacterium]